jgi:stress responsive alpha/beta barrel protein
MKKLALIVSTALILTVGASSLAAQNKFGQPKSILHVVTVLWTEDSTEDQRIAAIDGVKKMAAEIPGITNIWTKKLKVQGRGPTKDGKPGRAYDTLFVIEFKDQAAADAYADHPAHRAWEKVYLPIREQSTSHQVTN